MTQRPVLPTEDIVLKAVEEITDQARDLGRQASVLAVARRVGLSNTTFRRHFPDIARQISDTRRQDLGEAGAAQEQRHLSLVERNATLRRANAELHSHLELAIANIMRLTLENRRLRQDLEAANHVTRIDQPRRRADDQPHP